MRYELSDLEWAAIKPFLPNKPRGVPRVNDRRVLNGIFWILRSTRHRVLCRSTLAPPRPAPIAPFVGDGLPAGTRNWEPLPQRMLRGYR